MCGTCFLDVKLFDSPSTALLSNPEIAVFVDKLAARLEGLDRVLIAGVAVGVAAVGS